MPLLREDIETINKAVADGGNIWENALLADIKRKIKNHCKGKTREQCCYCRRDFSDEFNMVIDIEHVLPKSKFKEYMFELFNLSISCKRCNMLIKGERIDFLVDPATIRSDVENPEKYFIIHPNLDDYFSNIDYFMVVRNEKKTIKYIPSTNKGKFTYEFFKLDKIEIAALNKAQGINNTETELASDIPKDIAEDSTNLLEQLQ